MKNLCFGGSRIDLANKIIVPKYTRLATTDTIEQLKLLAKLHANIPVTVPLIDFSAAK